MTDVVGIRFKRAGKVYYFDPAGIELEINNYVVAETNRGEEVGFVVIAPKQVLASDVIKPLKPVLRKAGPEEVKRVQELEDKERKALVECGKLITKLGLEMKLLSAEYNLDGTHLIFFFTAAGRVDFRELVRGLANLFRVRVELRQVGARDEAKLLGDVGRCGRQLCCVSFLSEFAPISIRMAKEQGLSLNPMKISGVCDRLLCCLAYENDQYREMNKKLPKHNQRVSTATGIGRVLGSNPLKETVLVEFEGEVSIELPLNDITIEN